MDKQTKIYCGSAKTFGDYGHISVNLDLDMLQQHAYEYKGKRYVKVVVAKKREPDQYGKTHTVTIDTYKPQTSHGGNTSAPVVEPYPF